MHSPDWTDQGGMVQSHCHEQYPSDGENHFVLQQSTAEFHKNVWPPAQTDIIALDV